MSYDNGKEYEIIYRGEDGECHPCLIWADSRREAIEIWERTKGSEERFVDAW